jgi:hypothetical protein
VCPQPLQGQIFKKDPPMNPLKLRRLLISVHLYLAAFMAPAFLVVAISGGLYLAGIEGKTTDTPIDLPAGTRLDLKGPDAADQVRALLEAQGVDVSFEYLRGRGNAAMTRPTTRDYVSFEQGPDGLTASLHKPDFPYALMELHKGHGPRVYRTYQILVAVGLFIVVVGGLIVGLLATTYRRPTLVATAAGTVLVTLLGFIL